MLASLGARSSDTWKLFWYIYIICLFFFFFVLILGRPLVSQILPLWILSIFLFNFFFSK